MATGTRNPTFGRDEDQAGSKGFESLKEFLALFDNLAIELEVRDDRADVGDEHRADHESGPPHTVPLADKPGDGNDTRAGRVRPVPVYP